jgi:uncharacterized protein (DUF488 family)
MPGVRIHTIGHGTRPLDELVATLAAAEVGCLIDVRRYPSSRRNPQFNQRPLVEALADAGIEYRHEVELGGRLENEPGEERYPCLRVPAFRSYAARMAHPEYQAALERSLEVERPCFMCAETPWQRCHRRLIAELLTARGHEVIHLLGPSRQEPHRLYPESDVRAGKLYLCGSPVGERPSGPDRLIQQELFSEGNQ